MVDVYYDCPCGHRHSEHNWSAPPGWTGSCRRVDCDCWLYHGHRFGDPPWNERAGLPKIAPTMEMLSDDVHDLALALIRVAADDGTRVGFDAVLDIYGMTRQELGEK